MMTLLTLNTCSPPSHCSPFFNFFDVFVQEACIATAVALARRVPPRNLLLFGAYSIGKERVWLEVAKDLDRKVCVDAARYRAIECFGWSAADLGRVTTVNTATNVWVVPMGWLRFDRMQVRGERGERRERRKMTERGGRGEGRGRGSIKRQLKAARGSEGQRDDVRDNTHPCLNVIRIFIPYASLSPSLPLPRFLFSLASSPLPQELLSKYRTRFDSVVGFKPTGWAFNGGKKAGIGSVGGSGGTTGSGNTAAAQKSVTSFFGKKGAAGGGGGGGGGGSVAGVEEEEDPTRHLLPGGARVAGAHTRRASGKCTLYSLPYSEHSSFGELRRAVRAFPTHHIIPTVNRGQCGDMLRVLGAPGGP